MHFLPTGKRPTREVKEARDRHLLLRAVTPSPAFADVLSGKRADTGLSLGTPSEHQPQGPMSIFIYLVS